MWNKVNIVEGTDGVDGIEIDHGVVINGNEIEYSGTNIHVKVYDMAGVCHEKSHFPVKVVLTSAVSATEHILLP